MYVTFGKRSIYVAIFILFLVLVFFVECALIGDGNHSVNSADNNCLDFLEKNDISVDESSLKIEEVLLPYEFDEIYEDYNELQKQSGFDISLYRGKTVQKFSYRALGYDDVVFVNLLVYSDKIIGGDISSTALDGFMKPLI